jgi:hypothetical protein
MRSAAAVAEAATAPVVAEALADIDAAVAESKKAAAVHGHDYFSFCHHSTLDQLHNTFIPYYARFLLGSFQ